MLRRERIITVNRDLEVYMKSKSDEIYVNDVLFTNDMKTLLLYPSEKKNKVYCVPNGVKEIGEESFNNEYLEVLVLPYGLKSIVEYAFYCKNLLELYIPKSLSKVYLKAFCCCDAIKRVYFEGSEQEWNEIDFTLFNDTVKSAEIIFNYDYMSLNSDFS